MKLFKNIKKSLDDGVHSIEHSIENRGVGASYLSRAKRVQRNVNLAIFIGGVISLIGVSVWLLKDKEKGE